jgi:hypothetical protein
MAGVIFLTTFVLLGSGVLLHPGGFGLPSLQAWLVALEVQGSAFPTAGWLKLLSYEPATVALGAIGAVAAFRRRQDDPEALSLLAWAGAGLAAAGLVPDPAGSNILAAAIPLILLGGKHLGAAIEAMDGPSWRRAGLATAPVVTLVGLLALNSIRTVDGTASEVSIQSILALLTLMLLAFVALWPQDGRPLLPYPAATVVVAALLGVVSIHSLAHAGFAAGPSEWFGEPRPDATLLAQLNARGIRHSAAASVHVQAETIDVEQGLSSTVAWVLRDQDGVRYVTRAETGPVTVLLSGPSDLLDTTSYTSRSLPLASQWRPASIDVAGLWRWFMVREPYGAGPVERRVVLYRRS